MSTFTVQINCAEPPVTRYIDVYSSWGQSSNLDYDLYYIIDSYDFSNAVFMGTITSTTCNYVDTVDIPNGSTLVLLAVGAGLGIGDQVYIRGAGSSTCPGNLALACYYTTVVTADGSAAVTIYVNGSGDPQYCN